MFACALDSLVSERQALDASEAAWIHEVGEYDRSGQWCTDGYLNAAAALREHCHLDPGVAHGYVALARKLETLHGVADAFKRGRISSRHAQVIANAYAPERAADLDGMELELVDTATKFAPKQLRCFVRHITDAIDGDGGAGNDDKLYNAREAFLSETLGGGHHLDAHLDPVGGKILETALDAEMRRDLQPNDPRTTRQRRADAIVALARLALERGELGESHNIRPHFTYVVHTDDRAETQGYLSAANLELLLCDCDLSRVIVAGRSEILDVGRATRTVSAAQWKALVVRDGHCQAPGCNRPPCHCDAHHVKFWENGGPTDLENLKLFCWFHHREEHRRGRAPRPRARCRS
jgi:Domain of unknown function (DUF222)